MHHGHVEVNTQLKCIALLGAPNCGKTTLYNWLTGSRFKTVNYPGATVEYSIGKAAGHLQKELNFMDTPGTYSLHPKGEDEWVTVRALFDEPTKNNLCGVIVVLDGTQLPRQLPLVMQLQETGMPFVIAITMVDLLRKEDIQINIDYLLETFHCDVVAFDGLLAGGLKELVAAAEKLEASASVSKPQPWGAEVLEQRMKLSEKIADKALNSSGSTSEKVAKIVVATEKIDRFLLHPFFGFLFFILIMTGLFASVFWLAAPFMDLVDGAFSSLGSFVSSWDQNSLIVDFLAHGVVGSFASFMVFVPQIFILFLAIGVLESTGYLARAATLIDRPFAALGMSGRAFVPLLSGFACAVPAIMATRSIPSRRDRLITSFIVPLMSCSARLPVFALFIAFLFHDKNPLYAGLSMAGLYLGSILIGALAAGIVSRFIPRTENGLFMMELPIYRQPKIRVLLRQAWTRSLAYVKRAGPIIFVFSVLIWVGSTFPHYTEPNESTRLEQSYVGQLGHYIDPVMKPMGADWRVGIGLISAFAAREVFVSSLALTFNITDTDEDSTQDALLGQMALAVNSEGEKIFTVSTVVGLMIFVLIALQCISTVGVSIRESGSWKFAMAQLVSFNLAAYFITVIIVQGLRVLGVP